MHWASGIEHTTSNVGVAGTIDHVPLAVQLVRGLHTASLDTVAVEEVHSENNQQSVTGLQAHEVVAVAGADIHVTPSEQLYDELVHMRAEVRVGATAWYGVAPVQLIRFAHSPKAVGVALVVRYCKLKSQLWLLFHWMACDLDRAYDKEMLSEQLMAPQLSLPPKPPQQ